MRNCVPKANYNQPSLKQEFRNRMQRERRAKGDKRHLIASIGLAMMLAVSALFALAAFEAAKGASAGISPEPIPPEPAVAAEDVPPEPDAVRPLELAAAEPEPPAATTVITAGELSRGDTLAAALRRSNVAQNVIHLVATETSRAFDFRRAQPGHSFRLTQDLEGRVLDFR